MKTKMSRFVVLLLTTLVSVWFLQPTIKWYGFTTPKEKELLKMTQDEMDVQPPEIKLQVQKLKMLRKSVLSLGLDLQGGVNLTLQINEDDFKKQLLEKNDFNQAKADAAFQQEYLSASERVLEVLKNRMDQFGVAEPSIQKTFEGRISVELPGMNNPQLIREVLSKVGKLEFKIVDEVAMAKLAKLNVRMTNGMIASREDVPVSFELPEDSEWVASWKNDDYGIPKLEGWYVLSKDVEMDGTKIANARADADQYGRPDVSFTLSDEGSDIFGDLTAKNIKKRLAIVLDGKIKSAPVIQTEISGGSGVITGDFTQEETSFLANVLKAGSLPVKLDIVQERVIGATLGNDSIMQSSKAFLIGAIVVVIFMILYYKLSGFISIVALFFNMLFLIAVLAGFHATLTLSGIAGMALTIGMAVDANVIIYERIREEMRRSRSYKHALENGYIHASTTIWDSNLTTLIAAFVLFFFGAGTIKGFGLTLAVGIIANIFAALFVTRLIFDWWLDTFKVQKISV